MATFERRDSTTRKVTLHFLEVTHVTVSWKKQQVEIKGKAFYGSRDHEYQYKTMHVDLKEVLPDIPHGGHLHDWAHDKLLNHITVTPDQ